MNVNKKSMGNNSNLSVCAVENNYVVFSSLLSRMVWKTSVLETVSYVIQRGN